MTTAEVYWNGNFDKILDEAIAKGLNAAALQCEADMKQRLGTGSGSNEKIETLTYRYKKKDGDWVRKKDKTRRRFKSKKTRYPVSNPGEPPSIQTGLLRRSIGVERATPGNLLAVVGTGLSYGRWLEYGWANRNRDGTITHVPARPWALSTLQEHREKYLNLIENTVTAHLVKRLGGGK